VPVIACLREVTTQGHLAKKKGRVDLLKSRSPEVIWDCPSFGRTRGENPSVWVKALRAERAHISLKLPKPEGLKSRSAKEMKRYGPLDLEIHVATNQKLRVNCIGVSVES
jgi:hypothetical protein